MLNTFKDINVTLRNISLGVKVNVVFQKADGKLEVIVKDFPEALAMAFCKDLTSERVKGNGKAILVSGSTADAWIAIFEWMLLCSQAKHVVYFPKFPNYIFYGATRVAAAAEILGLVELVESMDKRMAAIAKNQVHTDDLWKVYVDLNCAQKYKDMVVESIANAIVEKRLRCAQSVRRLQYEMPHLGDDVKWQVDYLRKQAELN